MMCSSCLILTLRVCNLSLSLYQCHCDLICLRAETLRFHTVRFQLQSVFNILVFHVLLSFHVLTFSSLILTLLKKEATPSA